MKKLEGEGAISYLTRLQTTLESEASPKRGSRYRETGAQAGLLYTLVSLETTYLKINSEKHSALADSPAVMIEATGFPNTSMMLAHVKHLLSGLEIDERGKSSAVESWLDAIISFDTNGMTKSTELVARQVSDQEDVAKALSSLDMAKIRYLDQICRRPNDLLEIPLFVLPDHPGLLAASHEPNPFDQRWERGKNSKQKDERVDLRKYIDGRWEPNHSFGSEEQPLLLDAKGDILPDHPRWPVIIRTQIDRRHYPIEHFGSVLTPEGEVYFRREGDDNIHHEYVQSELTAKRVTFNDGTYQNYLVATFLDLDLSGFDNRGVDQTIELFRELYGSLDQVSDTYNTLTSSAQPSKQNLEKMMAINQRLERVVLSIDDPQIKTAVQMGIAEAIDKIRNRYKVPKTAQKFSWRTFLGNLTNKT